MMGFPLRMALYFHIGMSMMATGLGSYFLISPICTKYIGIEVVESC